MVGCNYLQLLAIYGIARTSVSQHDGHLHLCQLFDGLTYATAAISNEWLVSVNNGHSNGYLVGIEFV